MVLSVSTTLELSVSPRWNVPSAAGENTRTTLVRLVPLVVATKTSPDIPIRIIVYAPTAVPSDRQIASKIYSLTVSTTSDAITRPIGTSFIRMPGTAAVISSEH